MYSFGATAACTVCDSGAAALLRPLGGGAQLGWAPA
eukprot:gene26737-54178_t